MRHILVSEYRILLAEQAAIWGADDGADLSRGDPYWSAPLDHLSVSISLENSKRGDWSLVPETHVGKSGGLPRAAHAALVVLLDGADTLRKALSCHAALGHILVYTADCPCDSCSGRGTTQGSPCSRCSGTGRRQEAMIDKPAGGSDE